MDSPLKPEIVLASGSPRRRELLAELGWKFSIDSHHGEEVKIEGEPPEKMVMRLSREKASSVAARNQGRWIIGADTVVVIDGKDLGKPTDKEDAVRMVALLSGRTHTVITGVTLLAPDGRSLVRAEKTAVTFRKMSDKEVRDYVARGESMDKAGAYAIQGYGTLLVEKIDGCYCNVVGLPLECLSRMFESLGWPLSEQWRGN